MKNKLTERWKNDSLWREKWEIVMKCFLSSENIGKFDNSYYLPNGYLDLRGFDFNERVDFAKYTDKDYSSLIRETFGIIKKKKFENVDFSYVNLCERRMKNCQFINCIFNSSDFSGIQEFECQFINCNFYKGKFNGFIGVGQSLYKNVLFDSDGSGF